ncbi:ABC transporter permease [Streptosporangium sp. NPDC001559]|uniref:ABC transporter permease n=1 Tax=Streptosporangium sp. NPDC001559 TaxID=3366187 RepID=UPI0036E656C5
MTQIAPAPLAPQPAKILRGRSAVEIVIMLVAAALVVYLAVVPLLYLVYGTITDADGAFTLDGFSTAYSDGHLFELIKNTLIFAAGTTVFAVVGGTGLAYLTVRTDIPGRGLIFIAATVPLIIPGVLHTISWTFLASPRNSLLNTWTDNLFGIEPFNVFSMGGMIFVDGLHQMPLVFLLMYAAFRNTDPSFEESALMCGSRLPTVIARITLPLVKPALIGAIALTFVRAIEAFEVPAILGTPGGIRVFTSGIYNSLHLFPPDYSTAGALAMPVLVIAGVAMYFQRRLNKRTKSFQTVTGKGFRPRPLPLGRVKYALAPLTWLYFAVAVVLPVVMLAYVSAQKIYAGPSLESLGNLTLGNYGEILGNGNILQALRNSVVVGIGTATAVMVVMAIVSWITVRARPKGSGVLESLTFLPIGIPSLVLGVSLLFVYLRVPIPIYGTLLILVVSYFTKYMPYGMRYASSAMIQVSAELEESAQTSGATWLQTFRRVLVPTILPGLLSGWIYVLVVSFREVASSLLLYTPGNEVLSVVIWQQWENGQLTLLSALGIIMILILCLIVGASRVAASRFGVKEDGFNEVNH